MVKRLKQTPIAQGREKLYEQVSEITGAKILGLLTDIDVQLSERVFVFTTDRDIQYGTRCRPPDCRSGSRMSETRHPPQFFTSMLAAGALISCRPRSMIELG